MEVIFRSHSRFNLEAQVLLHVLSQCMVGDAHSVFKVYGKDDVIRAFDQRCKGRFRKVAIFPYFSIPAVLYVIGFASAKDNTISALIFGAIESLVGSCKQVFYALVPSRGSNITAPILQVILNSIPCARTARFEIEAWRFDSLCSTASRGISVNTSANSSRRTGRNGRRGGWLR